MRGGTVKLTSNWFVCLPEAGVAHANDCFRLNESRSDKERSVAVDPRRNAITNLEKCCPIALTVPITADRSGVRGARIPCDCGKPPSTKADGGKCQSNISDKNDFFFRLFP